MKAKSALLGLILCCVFILQMLSGCSEINIGYDFSPEFDASTVSVYKDEPYEVVNNNQPYFTDSDYTTVSFEKYSTLDAFGRCGTAYACVGRDIMPTAERGKIGSVKPTGWHTVKYDCVDGKYLYNRCHLIGYQLTGENANEKNLITGTRYLNIEGMLPFENTVANYVKSTDNHVLYRVTPVFEGNNLLAKGVLMEGKSVEDKGKGVCFNVFCYNSQPSIKIDYRDGSSSYKGGFSTGDTTYILNTSSKKIHLKGCSAAKDMLSKNKKVYKGNIKSLLKHGYTRCKMCNP